LGEDIINILLGRILYTIVTEDPFVEIDGS